MSDAKILAGKVVVVTGAGRGIGRGIAMMLAASGAKVVVNDLGASASGTGNDSLPAENVVAEIKALGGEAIANTDDISSEDGAKALVGTALERWGRCDIVINNAGILRDKSFHNMVL